VRRRDGRLRHWWAFGKFGRHIDQSPVKAIRTRARGASAESEISIPFARIR
jgi:hypothetical protein